MHTAMYQDRPDVGCVIHTHAPFATAFAVANRRIDCVFHRTAELAVLVGGVVEEAAQAALNAHMLGGPVAIPSDMRAAALQRAMAFDTAGTKTA